MPDRNRAGGDDASTKFTRLKLSAISLSHFFFSFLILLYMEDGSHWEGGASGVCTVHRPELMVHRDNSRTTKAANTKTSSFSSSSSSTRRRLDNEWGVRVITSLAG